MNSLAWREAQYWADVVAIRPEALVQRRLELSRQTREAHPHHLDLAYGADPRQAIDLFLPDAAGPHPLLMFIHGGYWQLSRREDWAFLAQPWITHGVAVACIGYRLVGTPALTDSCDDVQSAVRWLQQHSSGLGIDWQRSMLSGSSAGAHLAAMTITAGLSQPPAAAILLSGVYDLEPLLGTTPGQLLTASLQQDKTQITPLHRGTPQHTRCVIAWGGAETEVFRSQSLALWSHWANRGFRAGQMELPGRDHYTAIDDLLPESNSSLQQFLQASFSTG